MVGGWDDYYGRGAYGGMDYFNQPDYDEQYDTQVMEPDDNPKDPFEERDDESWHFMAYRALFCKEVSDAQ